MNLNQMAEMPQYLDGAFDLYDLVDVAEDDSPDFPQRAIKRRMIGDKPVTVPYREVQIYDRTRVTFEQADKIVTAKIRIPRWKDISSGCVCVIDGEQHKVYNKVDVISRQSSH